MSYYSSLNNFLSRNDEILHHGQLALFCNQTSWHFPSGKYLLEILAQRGVLRKLFIPEHGFFSELQDQKKFDETEKYSFLAPNTDIISLYGTKEESLYPQRNDLMGVDLVIVDIQDVGSRYFSFINSLFYLLKQLNELSSSPSLIIIDRPNPAGRKVEGSKLPEKYSSFIGLEGLPHRHGLTIGELCKYFYAQMKADFPIEVIPFDENEFNNPFLIQPSPNFPTKYTAKIYSGQCLFEGTVLSEGRGTTKPFEIFGAPFLNWKILEKIRKEISDDFPELNTSYSLRPLQFVPTFHKYAGELCYGFQLHFLKNNVHSLFLSMLLLQKIQKNTSIDIFRKGTYEYGSELSAIEILLGDDLLLDFIKGHVSSKEVKNYLKNAENSWIEGIRKHLLYPDECFSVSTFLK